VPNDPPNLPAGVYDLSARFKNGSGQIVQTTNSLSIGLAARIRSTPPTIANNAAGTLVTLSFDPQARPNQTVSLALGGGSAPAQGFTAPTASLSFQFPTLSPGSYLARLRVDGVDSPVTVDFTATPPVFTGPFIVV
jgi:hypothetical protein